MKQLDLQVIQKAREWLAAGKPVWLCTVLSTFGSAPRGPGAMLVAQASGEHRGSLSGGCVEDDFLQRLADDAFARCNQVVRYGEGGLAPSVKLPCGGVLDVLLEYVEPGVEADAHLAAVQQALTGGELVRRDIVLGSNERRHHPASMDDPRVLRDGERVSLRVGAAQRLLLAGLSPVAEYCASFALSLGYEVILCDPREEVTAGFAMPGVELVPVLPAVFISAGGCHGSTAVVALTHDPRLDDLTLLEAVRTRAFYIGAMGSQRTSASRRERLARIGGLKEAALARIHAPIGLQLGSKTPAEIAVAVMADIIRVASGVDRRAL
ncbi:XdhC family protein [Pseudomonas sp. NPDC090202]|uniref:XdhC family protein n=1 Tax=unclassified Pseudomonas TaxID=196821 RepID=UPI0038150EE4